MGNVLDKALKYIKYLTPLELKNFIRKAKRRYKRSFSLSKEERVPMDLEEFERILTDDLGIRKGDTLIVHSSFGNMNAGFSPQDTVALLKRLVGPSGNVLMPFYPTGHAFYWIQEDNVFDVHTSRSYMGVLTQVFKESDGVKLSPHPVKALSAWGKDRDWLIQEHHLSEYPYDEKSPYYKTRQLPGSKTLGLGVEINSFFHSCEDLFMKDKLEIYSDKRFEGKMNYYGKMMGVSTYLHQPDKVNSIISPCGFLKETGCPDYISVERKGAVFYSISNDAVYRHVKKCLDDGMSRTVYSQKKQ